MSRWNFRVRQAVVLFAVLWCAHPNSPFAQMEGADTVHTLLRSSREAVTAGRLEEGADLARRATELDPAFADAWKQYGRARMLIRPDDEARKALDRAWMLNPDWDGPLASWRADLALNLGDTESFVIQLAVMPDDALRNVPRSDVIRWTSLLLDVRQDKAAADLARRRAAVDQDSVAASLFLALAESADRRTRGVPASVESWAATSDDARRLSGLLVHFAGRRAFDRNETEQALAWFKQAWAIDPTRLPALGDAGWAALRLGDIPAAISIWEQGIAAGVSRPADWMIWIAGALDADGRLDAALETTEQALRVNPASAAAREWKTYLLLKTHRGDELEAWWQNRDGSPSDDPLIRGVVRFADSREKAGAAVRLLDPLRARDPVFHARLVSEIYTALALQAEGRDKVEYLRVAAENEPGHAALMTALGWAEWSEGNAQDAVTAWAAAAQSGASIQLALPAMAVMVEQGRVAEAMAWLGSPGSGSTAQDGAMALLRAGYIDAAAILLDQTRATAGDTPGHLAASALALAARGDCAAAGARLHELAELASRPGTAASLDLASGAEALCRDAGAQPPIFAEPENTAILRGVADGLFRAGQYQRAYALYLRVLDRDSGSDAWIGAARSAERAVASVQVEALLARATAAPVRPSVARHIESIRARRAGHIVESIDAAERSLQLDPAQPELRVELFHLLLAERRYEDAAAMLNRIVQLAERGDVRARADLVPLLVRAARHREAMALWNSVRTVSPGSIRQTLRAADQLARECRIEDAIALLAAVVRVHAGDARVYARLSDLRLASGDHASAVDWTDEGLRRYGDSILHRQRAELAAVVCDWPNVQRHADACLEQDPHDARMLERSGRALLMTGRAREAVERGRTLLATGASDADAHALLRDAYLQLGENAQAVEHGRHARTARPENSDDFFRLAAAWAADRQPAAAIRLLQPVAALPASAPIPVLLFDQVQACEEPGAISAEHWRRTVNDLSDAGYRFSLPGETNDPTTGAKVMIVVADPEAAAMGALDDALSAAGGRAILAVDAVRFRRQLLLARSDRTLESLAASGRWLIAQSVPEADLRDAGSDDSRLDALFAQAARALPGAPSVVLLPDSQDEGGRAPVRLSASRHFSHVIVRDDAGWILPGYEGVTISARPVRAPIFDEVVGIAPAGSVATELAGRNPVPRAMLELATVFSRAGLHDRADRWFIRAQTAGADPALLHYAWGVNALKQGDLPASLSRLRDAREIGSSDQIAILDALVEAERVKAPRWTLDLGGREESDDRSERHAVASARWHALDAWRLEVFAGWREWKEDGVDTENAVRAGAESVAFLAPGQWLALRPWVTVFEDGDGADQAGGRAAYHAGSDWMNGFVEWGYEHDVVSSAAAIRDDIRYDEFSLLAQSFIGGQVDASLAASRTFRTDENDGWSGDVKLLQRFSTEPYLALGYHGRRADTDAAVSAYYAPVELERHALLAAWRLELVAIEWSGEVEWGRGGEADRAWQDVWSGRVRAGVGITRELRLFAEAGHDDSPAHHETVVRFGLYGPW